ncbi:extracellular solute-binding protein [Chelatococcus asaccharovorans]|uniref:sn-glycerol-3-phosphate-binding periplasmic protein UgpB n=1 Tax=Chelatococcus asaccharovorans TaxID=28210 RepID=A0A2V3U881_9HYPH|nr:extracellular solute-binding protein [Chelatococcus asaccharovorans]MBS7705592.1 extracellular solute-binding protein [Chelatococcus asaccharovorans]PXW59996.1 carbohydrate ABC transporter substrate-binding protein (CUT1 family) [Chelatococcus asaccharovorans]
MHTTRRSFVMSGAAAAGALVLSPGRILAASPIELSISHGAPTYLNMLNALGTAFHADHSGMGAKFIADGDNWDPLLQNTLRESVVGALPDITWQSLTYARILAKRSVAQPLNEFAGDANAVENLGISRALVETTLVDGKIFALPFGTTIPVVYYNMDLLRKAGYQKPTPPTTWDEMIAIGRQVAALGGNINGGYIEYTSTNAWIFQNLLASLGGHMMNAKQTEIAFDGDEGLEAMRILARFGEINNVDMTQEQSRQAFNAGVSGIQIRSASGISSVVKAAAGHFELQIGEFPISSSAGRLVGAGHGFFMFTKNPDRQKASWEFLKFAAQAKGQAILAQFTGYMPINLLTLNDPAFLDQYFKANPYHRAIVKSLAVTGDQFSFPSDNTVKIVEMMADEMRKVVTKREKPEDSLATMATETRKMLQS